MGYEIHLESLHELGFKVFVFRLLLIMLVEVAADPVFEQLNEMLGFGRLASFRANGVDLRAQLGSSSVRIAYPLSRSLCMKFSMALTFGMSKGLPLKMKMAICPYLKTKMLFFFPLLKATVLKKVGWYLT